MRRFSSLNEAEPVHSLPFILRARIRTAKSDSRFETMSEATPSKWNTISDIDYFLKNASASPRELSVLAWSVSKLSLDDPEVWSKLIAKFTQLHSVDFPDTCAFLFSLSSAVTRDAASVPEPCLQTLETWLANSMKNSLPDANLADLAQACYSFAVLFHQSPLVRPLLKRTETVLTSLPLRESEDNIPSLSSCREVCLLWSACRVLRKVSPRFIDALSEASRGLRFCSDFNQNKVAQLCDNISFLNVDDPRVVYAVILFVAKNASEINAKNLLRIIRGMSRLQVDNEVVWKRLAGRMEDPIGLRYSVRELEEIRNAFRIYKKNQRIFGILDLYIRTKLDASKYGPT